MEEELKILHFPVARGDCTLIMIHAQDGSPEKSWHIVSILIDTGQLKNASTMWDAIWKQITDEYARLQKNYPPEKRQKPRLNYFIISHFDEDHFNWAESFLETLRKNREQEKGIGNEWQWVDELYVVDRIAALPIDLSRGDLGVNEDLVRYEYPMDGKGNPKDQVKPYLKAVRAYRPYADKNLRLREGDDLLQQGQTYRLPSFQMLCLAANGFIAGALAAQRQGSEVPKPGKPTKERFFDENDLSFAFLLSFGTFRYYTGGDLTGSHGMEKALVDYLKGIFIPKATDERRPVFHACVVLLHHHGSKHSTLGDFLDYFKPRIAVCSADGNPIKRNRHPTTEVIQRLRGQAGRRGTLLCTFRLANKGFEEPSRVELKNLAREFWRIEGAPLQDVILHVIAEKGRSPLVKGQRPRIRIFRRLRENLKATDRYGFLKDPKDPPEEPYETDDSVLNGICDCEGDHDHAIFGLPTGIPQP